MKLEVAVLHLKLIIKRKKKGKEGKEREEGAAFKAWPGVTCIPEAL